MKLINTFDQTLFIKRKNQLNSIKQTDLALMFGIKVVSVNTLFKRKLLANDGFQEMRFVLCEVIYQKFFPQIENDGRAYNVNKKNSIFNVKITILI